MKKAMLFVLCYVFLTVNACYGITKTEIKYNQDRINTYCNVSLMRTNNNDYDIGDGIVYSEYCLQALNNKILIDIYNQMLMNNKRK